MHAADLAIIDLLRAYAARIASAGHGAKSVVVAEACERLQMSQATLYKRMGDLGLTRARKRRSDAGTTRLPEEVARIGGGLVALATRANGKRTLTIKGAARQLQANGLGMVDPETGEVGGFSVSTLSRAMRLRQCHPDQLAVPSAHTNLVSLHPNHVWQVDCSVCVIFYAPEGGLRVKAIDDTDVYKNKPDAVARVARDLCLRWAIVDHTSGAFYSGYHAGAEDSTSFNEFFIRAIQQRAGQPFHGVPRILMLDPGAAARAATSRNLLERLGVQVIQHRPKNPRAKGMVEGLHNLIEREFEGLLRQWKPADIDSLNAWHDKWRVAYCATERHSRHGMTRFGAWTRIREEQLIIAPPVELCRELVVSRPVERTVTGDLSISYVCPGHKSAIYTLRHLPEVYPKQKVRVVVNAYRLPDVDVLIDAPDGTVATYTVSPAELNEYGFIAAGAVIGEGYKAQPKSQAERNLDRIAQEAYGLPSMEDAKRQRAQRTAYTGDGAITLNPFAHIEQVQAPTYLPKRGREHGAVVAARDLPNVEITQAVRRLRNAGDKSSDLYARLASRFTDGFVPADWLQAEVETLQLLHNPAAAAG